MALENETEPLMITGKKKTFQPTGNKILEPFQVVKVIYVKEGGVVKRHLPERYNKLSRALKMIGFWKIIENNGYEKYNFLCSRVRKIKGKDH